MSTEAIGLIGDGEEVGEGGDYIPALRWAVVRAILRFH